MDELFSKRLSELINDNNYTLDEIENYVGKTNATISRYASGEITGVKRSTIVKLANFFNVSPAWLAGFTDQKYDNTDSKQVFPLLGTVKAGYNYLAHENIIGYVYIDGTIPNPEEYFALKVTGDSMQPVLYDGDIVIVHSQNDIESGQIGIVLLNNDEATTKKVVNGNIIRVKNPNNNLITVDGMHEPIISLDLWNKVQSVRKSNLINKERVDYSLKNPMSNIVKCGICGRAMQRITYVGRNDVRLCCRRCKENVGSNINFVEDKLLQSLTALLKEYKIKLLKNDNSDNDLLLKANEQSINKNLSELEKANLQLNNLYDLLEQGIYTKELFLQRMQLAKDKISSLQDTINELNEEKEKILNAKNNKEIIIPKIENVIDTYYETDDIELKNKLLKSVLYKVDYLKINPKDKDDFKLILYPKLY